VEIVVVAVGTAAPVIVAISHNTRLGQLLQGDPPPRAGTGTSLERFAGDTVDESGHQESSPVMGLPCCRKRDIDRLKRHRQRLIVDDRPPCTPMEGSRSRRDLRSAETVLVLELGGEPME